jgi:carbamoyl-phosphate synthase large subunit
MRILISGLGGSLFPYLHNKLAKKHCLYYVDNDAYLEKIYPDLNFFHAPSVHEKKYFSFIRKIIKENNIEVYVPLIDEEIMGAIENFRKDIIVIAPSECFTKICLDKYKLMKELERNDISRIPTSLASNFHREKNFSSLFLKPRVGRGSRGICETTSRDEFDSYFKLNKIDKKDVIVQPCIRGDEYTVGVLVNNQNDLMAISPKKVIRKKGITQLAVTSNNEHINKCVSKLVNKMKPSGLFNVQLFITDKKEVKIFEINPRLSTTSILSYEAGIDKINLFLEYFDRKFKNNILYPPDGLFIHRTWKSDFYFQNND